MLQRVASGIIIADVFLIPLLFIPITSDFYEFNKQAFLMLSTLVLVFLWVGMFISDKQVRLTRSPLGLPMLGLLAAWLLSTFIKSPNLMDAFFAPTQTGTIISLVLFFFVSINIIRTRQEVESLTWAMILSLLILAVVSILWSSGLIVNLLPFSFLNTPAWTPTGNIFSSMIVMLCFLPFLGVFAFKEKGNPAKSFVVALSLLLIVVGSGTIAYRLFKPGSPFTPTFLPQSTAWAISLEALKTSPLLGTGPSTFDQDFTMFRPINFNLNPNWAVRFTSASDYYLQLLSTVGLLGLLTYAILAFRQFGITLKLLKFSGDTPSHTILFASALTGSLLLLVQLFVYPSFVHLFFTFVLLALTVVSLRLIGSSMVHEASIDIVANSDSGFRTPILPWIALILAIALATPTLYYGSRVYAGEVIFESALASAARNDGRATYNTLIQAINTNPYRDAYRVAYSQTNLLLANSLASQKNLTSQDRDTISQLIQQAIREAKNAVALNPNKVSNVENLANIYRNLLNIAQGADSWTIASYTQAIQLDPANPNLRIALGGVYYSLKQYDQAITYFRQAVNLKPDLANAYYNLAVALRQSGDYQNALVAMQSVTQLLDKNSSDYAKAESELEALQKQVGATATPTPTPRPAASQLEAPQPLPSPKVNPPIKLPANLGPTSATPSATPAH